MPIALVTGANQGIGLAIARGLARRGVTVLLGARRLNAGRAAAAELAADDLAVEAIPLDVTVPDSVVAAAGAIEACGALDILINNAGISDPEDGPVGAAEPAAVRRIFDVNFFGAHLVTRALLPALRRSPAARIVNLSSALGSIALSVPGASRYRNDLFGYKASKAALGMLTVMLAYELAGTPHKVNAATPGYTPTSLNAHLPPPPIAGQTLDEAAVVPIRLALLPPDGPSGKFFAITGEIAW